ncbi:malonate decarboxylase acyl carrier protein [Companilactobacillus versmoldensis]|uniref:Malonate decarboxylase acyl carrier protein n=1 Tax=Companilactobacillus versmoldensis DSM 14857 = KCTC 3814 TaxID=1423815 RepID=A0A0R1SR85_9LACO|nr:malonate decarboxylase acyl carrier protein [Companilactobacillus versmoldensis]KRL67675.1 malonate decarboxylase subunit delta [Companilactobacillus versmoldensis DSM 14857 = KCTC 3814]
MEKLHFNFDTTDAIKKPVHVGVVASGDLEVIFRPTDKQTEINIVTGSDGFHDVWENVLTRFFDRYPVKANIEINDFGSTPGVVNLRLTQALEALKDEK